LSGIELRQVTKSYRPGAGAALESVELSIQEGERVVVLGPSGSGKTTLLRLIAGLETPDTGSVWIGGRDMDRVPPHRRDVAMVFQNPALYPHLSVFDNLAFSAKARRMNRAERLKRVHEVAGMLGMERLLARRPAELSGGERQRVALGRAVVRGPRVLLLDEPFSGLDEPLRASLRDEVVELHRRFGSTLVHVTHDQDEALSMGQRLAVLHQGRLLQFGLPREIYDRPACGFVASFVGSPGMSVIPCDVVREETGIRLHLVGSDPQDAWRIPMGTAPFQELPLNQPQLLGLGIRPEAVDLAGGSVGPTPPEMTLPIGVVIRRVEYRGGSVLASLAIGSHRLFAWLSTSLDLQEGQRAVALVDLQRCSWFDPQGGRRIADPGNSR
jgi:ABC-type sugar transport system ATPase subunit